MWNAMRMYAAPATGRYKSYKDYHRRVSYDTGQTNHNRRNIE